MVVLRMRAYQSGTLEETAARSGSKPSAILHSVNTGHGRTEFFAPPIRLQDARVSRTRTIAEPCLPFPPFLRYTAPAISKLVSHSANSEPNPLAASCKLETSVSLSRS